MQPHAPWRGVRYCIILHLRRRQHGCVMRQEKHTQTAQSTSILLRVLQCVDPGFLSRRAQPPKEGEQWRHLVAPEGAFRERPSKSALVRFAPPCVLQTDLSSHTPMNNESPHRPEEIVQHFPADFLDLQKRGIADASQLLREKLIENHAEFRLHTLLAAPL